MRPPSSRPDYSANACLPGAGMPQERLARMAARSTFVELRQQFAQAASGVPGSRGSWLRGQVRQARDLSDLWLLRGAMFSALRDLHDDREQGAMLELYMALSSVFPEDEALLPPLS